VIVTRRVIDPEVYDRALELGVCADTFGGFSRAAKDLDHVEDYVHREQTYIEKRLTATRAVTSMARRGHRAWVVYRISELRPLTIATHEPYELTDDQLTEILNQYPKLSLDALVITNPAAQGFGARVARSAQHAGVPLFTLNDFIADIRKPWT
jgi:hypothetical protein